MGVGKTVSFNIKPVNMVEEKSLTPAGYFLATALVVAARRSVSIRIGSIGG